MRKAVFAALATILCLPIYSYWPVFCYTEHRHCQIHAISITVQPLLTPSTGTATTLTFHRPSPPSLSTDRYYSHLLSYRRYSGLLPTVSYSCFLPTVNTLTIHRTVATLAFYHHYSHLPPTVIHPRHRFLTTRTNQNRAIKMSGTVASVVSASTTDIKLAFMTIPADVCSL